MTSQAATDSKAKMKQRFALWFDILSHANQSPRNNELLTEYFFRQFAVDPKNFFAFLVELKNELEQKKNEKHKHPIALQYLSVLSPLCERFGIFDIKNTLDEQCCRITQPEEYKEVESTLSSYREKSKEIVKNVLDILRSLLKEKGYKCEVKGRYKNTYNVYRKLKRKGYDYPLALHDIFAFRIILESNVTQDCFDALNLLHDKFVPIASRFKDYITIPKINGYQSIHTCLNGIIPDLNLPVEIQIRTRVMNQYAERGVASHWLYAKGKKTHLLTPTEEKLLQHFSYLSRQAEADEHITCLSIGGDVFSLPKGATVLDFAYGIHTDVGNKAKGAIVSGIDRDIGHKIQEGDRIQVIMGKKNQVNSGWLNNAYCPYTRKKIHENTRY